MGGPGSGRYGRDGKIRDKKAPQKTARAVALDDPFKRRRGPKRNPSAPHPRVKSEPIIDYPTAEVAVPRANGKPSDLCFPVAYLPYLEALPKPDLRAALLEDDTPEAALLYKALADPRLAGVPITALASRCGIRIPRMIEMWRHHRQVEAMGIAIDGAPAAARDLVIDARSTTVCCTRCDGAGTMRIQREDGTAWIECKTCKGSGEIRKIGDIKSREWVLRAAGVIAAEAGPSVNLNFNQPSASSVIDELERATTVTAVAIPDDDA